MTQAGDPEGRLGDRWAESYFVSSRFLRASGMAQLGTMPLLHVTVVLCLFGGEEVVVSLPRPHYL